VFSVIGSPPNFKRLVTSLWRLLLFGSRNVSVTEATFAGAVRGYWHMNEATPPIKINELLEAADWNVFSDGRVPKSIRLE